GSAGRHLRRDRLLSQTLKDADPHRHHPQSGTRQAGAALAVRHQDDRDVLPTGPNLLRHVVADALAKKKNESRCAHDPCVAAGAHHSGPRALLRIERQRDTAAGIRLVVAELGRRPVAPRYEGAKEDAQNKAPTSGTDAGMLPFPPIPSPPTAELEVG